MNAPPFANAAAPGADAVPFVKGDRVELFARDSQKSLGAGTVLRCEPFKIAISHDGGGLTMVAGPCDRTFEVRAA